MPPNHCQLTKKCIFTLTGFCFWLEADVGRRAFEPLLRGGALPASLAPAALRCDPKAAVTRSTRSKTHLKYISIFHKAQSFQDFFSIILSHASSSKHSDCFRRYEQPLECLQLAKYKIMLKIFVKLFWWKWVLVIFYLCLLCTSIAFARPESPHTLCHPFFIVTIGPLGNIERFWT